MPVPRLLPDANAVTTAKAQPANTSTATKAAAPSGPKNPIMKLNEIAMTAGISIEWGLLSDSGPAHMRSFTWSLKMGEYSCMGSGPNKKLARAQAAQNMLEALPDEIKNMANQPKAKRKSQAKKRKMDSFWGRKPGEPAAEAAPAAEDSTPACLMD